MTKACLITQYRFKYPLEINIYKIVISFLQKVPEHNELAQNTSIISALILQDNKLHRKVNLL